MSKSIYVCISSLRSPSHSDSLQPHGLQHTRTPSLSPTPGVYSNSCPLSLWWHPTISSSAVSFSSHLQSFPASGSFQTSQFFGIRWPNIPSLWASFPPKPHPIPLVVIKHRAKLSEPCGSFPLAICFTQNSIYMSVVISQFIPFSPCPTRWWLFLERPAYEIGLQLASGNLGFRLTH